MPQRPNQNSSGSAGSWPTIKSWAPRYQALVNELVTAEGGGVWERVGPDASRPTRQMPYGAAVPPPLELSVYQ